jgi:glycosyltransferase involved in cell wall biosynthesis
MKVLIVSNVYYPNIVGGAEKAAKYVAEGLVARDHEAVVVTLSPQKRSEVAMVNGVRVYYLPVKNLYYPLPHNSRSNATKGLWHAMDTYNPFMAASLGRILDSERPDVVNTHNLAGFSTSIWRAVKKRQIPLVHTAHDYYLLCPRSTMRRKDDNCNEVCADCLFYSWPRKQASQLVDVATADSRHTLDRHLRRGYFLSAESMPLYNCCELPSKCADRENEGHCPLRFGFLGRLHPTKGVDLLLRSFLSLPRGQAELVLAGQGSSEYERELKAMVNGHTEVRWLGYVSPEVLFRQVDVLVVPSLWHDSAPLVVLESMAHFVPLISSCRGGIPELMGKGTGWLFDPDDPNALIQALRKAIESRAGLAVMRERAHERACLFSIEAMVQGYLQAFSRSIDKNGAQTVRRPSLHRDTCQQPEEPTEI